MKDFKPNLLKCLNNKSASNFIKLTSEIRAHKCTLVFGAGLAASVGLPDWNQFINKICFTYFYRWIFDIVQNNKKITYEKPPSNISVGFTEIYDYYLLKKKIQKLTNTSEDFFKSSPENTKIYIDEKLLSSSKTVDFVKSSNDVEEKSNEIFKSIIKEIKNYDPLLIAQMIKNRIRTTDWNYLLKKCLYNSYEYSPFKITSSKLIDALIQLIKIAGISEIINFNYDDIFYHILKNNNLNFKNIYSEISGKNIKNRIYYPHGYLPLKGGEKTKLILSEEDYQEENFQFDNWSNKIQSSIYINTSCIFIGLSLTDPNLRGILKSCNKAAKYNHYAFLPACNTNYSKVQLMMNSLFDADLQRLGIKVIRYPLTKKPDCYSKLPYIINILIKILSNEIKLFKI